jgi:radical SAM/Cys-rich protein
MGSPKRVTLPRYAERRSSFDDVLRAHGAAPLTRGRITTLQVNVGKLCNLACLHCHVEAGPKRTEIMARATAERVIALLDASPGLSTLDLTGGAPELNPSFRALVHEARRRGLRVIDRCNLTVLFEPGMADLAEFLAEQRVQIVASLPCYSETNVDAQRGRGTFELSIEALQRLNELGYGAADSGLELDLVYNPLGASLPPAQASLEARYKLELRSGFGIEFNSLLTITNMPLARFAHALERDGLFDEYMSVLANHFNPLTLPGLMCRTLLSVGYDGKLYDCDFHQMAEVPLGASPRTGIGSIFEVDSLDGLTGHDIATAAHCFGCTAGSGSSCGGSLQ